MRLVSPDQATPEDHGEVYGGQLARPQGAGAGVHVESGRLEL